MPDTLTPTEAPAKRYTYGDAVRLALGECLRSDERAILFGEDIALPGGVFGVTRGLKREFGDRVFDTPISESAILGSAVGAAMMGMHPIVEIMWLDFSLVAMDQIVNQVANIRYVHRGALGSRIVIRTQQGWTPGACAQHGQNLEALYLHVPGLRVCMPWSAQNAYDMLLQAHASEDPVLFIESRSLYNQEKVELDLHGTPGPIGGAVVRREGDAGTVVCWGRVTASVIEAADIVHARTGASITIVETPWLNPFPIDEVRRAVDATGRLLVVHEANLTGGFGAEVVARICESGARLTKAPRRHGLPDMRVPAAVSLMESLTPSVESITRAIEELIA